MGTNYLSLQSRSLKIQEHEWTLCICTIISTLETWKKSSTNLKERCVTERALSPSQELADDEINVFCLLLGRVSILIHKSEEQYDKQWRIDSIRGWSW